MKRILRIVFQGGLLLLYIWMMGLLWFIDAMPRPGQEDAEPVDAIVVLTGGTLRVERGFDLLAEQRAKKLFISGVGGQADVKALLRAARRESPGFAFRAEDVTVLGYEASDTIGNAEETARFMKREGFTTLRLVTSNYHMPRALLEFRRAMPNVQIHPASVFPEQFKREEWWRFPGTARLILTEYHKIIGSLLRGAPVKEASPKKAPA